MEADGDWLPGLAREHLGLMIGVATGAVVFARLLMVSAFDHETAMALLTYQGTATVVVGSLLAVAYLVPFAVMLIAAYAAISISRRYTPAYVALSVVNVFTAPLILGLIIAGLLLFMLAQQLLAARRVAPSAHAGKAPNTDQMRMRVVAVRNIMILWAVFVGGSALVHASPWMPAEHITTVESGNERTSRVGYVLEERDDTLVVLLDSPREVVRLLRNANVKREFCERTDSVQGGKPLVVHLFSPRPRYPACPTTG